ncbi:glycine betaine ABC transporter substrate-binding protein [Patulibacter sp.]|uniref:glycine betaine ABC transporter substrate-binding protein n=1 Tax=Patulibacter sp. TaxID=1912859 RepID=UPI002716A323|nr:glycine betaine ABC transporter substrate-binding protein [Patulibacter sp.]MDO9408415.1 glycine betaine ABC transporter substrate-binding protein [Patulibacter sp.]
MSIRTRLVTGLAAAALVPALAGCGAQYSGGGEGPLKGAKIAFGSKDFTEQKVLGQIAVQYLRSQGAAVWDQTGLVSSQAVRGSLERDDINAYWEYTGTAWITYFGKEKPIQDTKEQYDAVKAFDLKKNQIDWVDPAPLNNTYAFAIKASKAKELGITKLGDIKDLLASPKGKDLTFCIESEFANRPDGFPGVQKTYGFKVASDRVKRLDTGLIYSQTGNGTCTFGEVFTTDGRVEGLDLLPLTDDKKFFPVYQAAISIREDLLKEHPQIERVMKPIAAKLTTKEMLKLNAEVDIEGVLPDKVARDWLKDEGFTD